MTTLSEALLGPNRTLGKASYAAPHACLRTAIFSSLRPQGRAGRTVYIKPTELGAYGKYRVWQRTGSQLDQSDFDVWLQLVKMAMPAEIEDFTDLRLVPVVFTAPELLRALGRAPGGSNTTWLINTVDRLGDARFDIELPNGSRYAGNLIHERIVQPAKATDGRIYYTVHLNSRLTEIFADGWQKLDCAQRAALGHRSADGDLAQWLHGFYSTHEVPAPVGLAKLRVLSGRGLMEPSKFKTDLRAALKRLAEVTKWSCVIDGSVVRIDRGLMGNAVKRAIKAGKTASVPIFALTKSAKRKSTPATLPADDDENDI